MLDPPPLLGKVGASFSRAQPGPRTASTMPQVTYVSHDGKSTTLDVPLGTSVMQAATLHGIDGIVAECGGSCMCATCHVYVKEDQLSKLPEMELGEDAMLDGTASPRKPNSRLSCQLVMTPQMEGLVVTMPETQT
jgi:2Fe-2S ferredoxin